MTDRLYRSQTDRVIAGVAGGLAAWLRIDPSIVRVGWVVLAVLTGGIFLLVYIVMMIVVPLAPDGWMPSPGPPPGGSWSPPPNAGQWGPPPNAGQWALAAADGPVDRRPAGLSADRAVDATAERARTVVEGPGYRPTSGSSAGSCSLASASGSSWTSTCTSTGSSCGRSS